jgi:hypothetical protein
MTINVAAPSKLLGKEVSRERGFSMETPRLTITRAPDGTWKLIAHNGTVIGTGRLGIINEIAAV